MKYTQSSFSVGAPGTDQYRENWERTFGKVQVKSCNRHSDCVAADQNSQASLGKTYITATMTLVKTVLDGDLLCILIQGIVIASGVLDIRIKDL